MNKLKTCRILMLAFFILCTGCKESPENISLGSFTDEQCEIGGFPETDCGYIIYDIDQQKTVKSHNALKEFIPASVTKLFTAVFAREVLGGDYSFTTSISHNGIIENGILKGDIYLTGSGDPELSHEGLLSLAAKLKSLNIGEVTGHFFYDDTLFTTRESLENSMPPEAYYNAGIGPLTFNSNTIYAIRRKDREGKIISCDLLPSLPSFSSRLYEETPVYPFFKFNRSGGRELWGLPRKRFWDNRQPLPVKNPGLYTAEIFRRLCEIQGIKLRQSKQGKTSGRPSIIAEYKSRPLDLIIKNLLSTSNNITAELLNIIASHKYSEKNKIAGSDKNPMEDFFRTGFPRIKWNGFHAENASGLTSMNRATPEQTAAVLLYMEKKNNGCLKPENMLPVSGWDGTMRMRLDQPETAFRVYAKTGNIFYATSLAGMFYAKSGKKYLFSVYINDFTKRTSHDLKNEKTIYDANGAAVWTKKGMASIDEFIRKMIENL